MDAERNRRRGDGPSNVFQLRGRVGDARIDERERELVAAESRAQVRAPDGLRQPRRDFAQHVVAGTVAGGIVDAIELIDVDDGERERPMGAGRSHQLHREALLEVRAVQQTREVVANRREPQPSRPRRDDARQHHRRGDDHQLLDLAHPVDAAVLEVVDERDPLDRGEQAGEGRDAAVVAQAGRQDGEDVQRERDAAGERELRERADEHGGVVDADERDIERRAGEAEPGQWRMTSGKL